MCVCVVFVCFTCIGPDCFLFLFVFFGVFSVICFELEVLKVECVRFCQVIPFGK